MKKLFFLLIILCGAFSAEAATRYVDPSSGSCSGNYNVSARNCTGGAGSPTAYATLNTGVASLSAGDTLILRPATYNFASSYMTLALPTGNASSVTIITALSGETVTITGYPFNTFNAAASYVTISNLIFDGTGASGQPNCFTPIGGGTTCLNNGPIIGSNTNHGTIDANITLDNVEIRNWNGIAVQLGGPQATIKNSRVHDNGTVSNDNCVYASDGATNAIIESNTVYNCAGAGIQAYAGADPAGPATIRFNTIHHVSQSERHINGFYVEDGAVEDRMDGIIVASRFDNSKVYGNVIYSVKRSTGNQQGGIALVLSVSGVAVYNNTLWDVSGGGVLHSGAGCNIFRNNIVYEPAFSTPAIEDTSGCSTFSNNLTASNPLFTDTSTANFVLLPGSPAIDTGTPNIAPGIVIPACSGGTTTGCYNGTGPDIGALESGVPTVAGGPPTLRPNPPTGIRVSQLMSVTVEDDKVTQRTENTGDYVGLYIPGALSTAFIDWFYMNGTKVAPSSPISDAILAFTAPSAVGSYEFRFYRNNSTSETDRLATVGFVTVAQGIMVKYNGSSIIKMNGSSIVKVGVP